MKIKIVGKINLRKLRDRKKKKKKVMFSLGKERNRHFK
jgi:hypothetical protein